MTSTKGNGTGMRQIWKTIMMMMTFALVVAAIVGSHYKGKADTTSQITTVQNDITAVETEQEHMKAGIEKLAGEFEDETMRAETADTSMIRQMADVAHRIDLLEQSVNNGFEKILEKLE